MELSFRRESITMQSVLCSTKQSGEKLAFPFLWKGKPEALKRKSLLNTFADGGLNVVDIRTKIECLFVKKVLQLIKSITPGGPP